MMLILLLGQTGRGSWARLTGNVFSANGEHGLLVADRAAAVLVSGVFEQHAYGALVMDSGSYLWVPDAQEISFLDHSEHGVFAGRLRRVST